MAGRRVENTEEVAVPRTHASSWREAKSSHELSGAKNGDDDDDGRNRDGQNGDVEILWHAERKKGGKTTSKVFSGDIPR